MLSASANKVTTDLALTIDNPRHATSIGNRVIPMPQIMTSSATGGGMLRKAHSTRRLTEWRPVATAWLEVPPRPYLAPS